LTLLWPGLDQLGPSKTYIHTLVPKFGGAISKF
jgi:hypothetical protein